MATQVDNASSHHAQTAVTATSSAASASIPRVSMFGKKSGFVIPKNKLSGSLVPIIRGAGKIEVRDTSREQGNKQVQRKTKWGADLTEDSAVRKGRALAYQTRVDQITQQLKAGVVENEDGKGAKLLEEVPDPESSRPRKDDQSQKFEMLELEKREAIGEILKLSPSYKPPPDYKPLLKEAKIHIPLARYPGYNFIGVILGSGSNTLKRLEEETGAKIQIYGTKAGTGEKGEITSSNGNEVQGAYEELYVHVSADTFEKVDAAVALIELLVAPVSGKNSAVASTTSAAASGDGQNVFDLNVKDTPIVTSYMAPIGASLNHGMVEPMLGSSQPGSLQVQFQPYRGPWFSTGPPNTATRTHSGFAPPNSSAPNGLQFSPTPINPSNMRPFFSGQPQPPSSSGFGLVPRNPSHFAPRPQPWMQGLQHSYMPEVRTSSQSFPSMNHPIMPNQQNSHGYPSMPHSQSIPTGLAPVGGQMLYSTPPPVPTTAMGSYPVGQLNPSGSSSGWSGAPFAARESLGMTNTMQIAKTMVPPQSLHTVGPIGAMLNAPSTVVSGSTAGNMVSHAGIQFQHSNQLSSSTLINPPAAGQAFASRQSLGPVPLSVSVPPLPLPSNMHSSASAQSSIAEPTLGPLSLASSQLQSGLQNSVSGILPGPASIPPPVTTPRPQRPISGDFTFQPLRPQFPASSQPSAGPSNQSVAQHAPHTPPNPSAQPSPPQAPSFRLAVHNSTLQVSMQGFPSSRATNQAGQPQAPIPASSPGPVIPFAANPFPLQPSPRLPSFQILNPILLASSVPQQVRPMSSSPGSLPTRPVNTPQLQQNQQLGPAMGGPCSSLVVPDQQFSNNVTFLPSSKPALNPGGNQIYDPFSPTSVPSSAPQQGE